MRRYTAAPLVYLEQWLDAQGAADKKWKLDKNIQNWLLYNVFDEEQVGPGVCHPDCLLIVHSHTFASSSSSPAGYLPECLLIVHSY